MSALELVVAGMAFLFIGAALAALAFFCVYLLKMMRGLQNSSTEVVKTSTAALAEARSIAVLMEKTVERNFGEGSPTARAARSVGTLANSLPETLAGLKVFGESMKAICEVMFDQNKVAKASASERSPMVEESQFIPYSEETAAQYERQRRADAERLDLSREEMAGMRTDKEPPEVKEVPEPATTEA